MPSKKWVVASVCLPSLPESLYGKGKLHDNPGPLMPKGWISVFLPLLFLRGQEEQRIFSPSPVIKFMPLAMIDPFQYTLHGGVEFPVGLTNTLQAEGGWVFGYLGQAVETDFTQQGFKLRLSWREYFTPKTMKGSPSRILQGGYLALMGSYQHYSQTIEIDTSGGYGYFREYRRSIQGVEGAFLLGYQTQVGQRLSIDLWGGLGLCYATHRWSPAKPGFSGLIPPRITPVGDFILLPGGRPVPRMGMAIGWILR